MDIARVYDDPHDDSLRVLVDRIWPRGLRKDDPRIGRWDKEVAPSTELRKWYGHDPEKYDEFASRYRDELKGSDALKGLKKLAKDRRVTLVTATKELDLSHVTVLRDLLTGAK